MAYPANFLRLVANGTLYTVERFSWSLSLIGNGVAPTEVPPAVISAVTAFHGGQQVTSVPARLTDIKLNLIGTDGRYVSQTDTVQHDLPTPVQGTSGARHPAQIAQAITLRTGVRRGLASNGRFYLPLPAGELATDGRVEPVNAELLAEAAQTLVESLNAAMDGWRVGVVSNVGAGAARPVTAVGVGRVLDTIRSRRSSIPEGHVELPIAGGGGEGGGEF